MEQDQAQDWDMQAKSTDWFEILSTCREEDSATRGFKLLHKEWKKEENRLGLATRLWATEEEPWRLLVQLWATNFVVGWGRGVGVEECCYHDALRALKIFI